MEDLRAVVEAIGNRPVIMIGISRGATVATHFASRYPHLVDKMVVVGATPAHRRAPDFPFSDRVDAEFYRRLSAALAADDWPVVVRTFMAQVCAGEPGCQKLIEHYIQLWSQIPLETRKNFFMLDDPGRDVRPLLPTLRMPTLVLHGEVDRLAPVEAARWLAERIPGAQFHALEGRSHMMPTTATTEFTELVLSFIRTGRPT